jgi:hypothetical protein
MIETPLSDSALGTAVLLAVKANGFGLVFEPARAQLQTFRAPLAAAPSSNPLIAGLVSNDGQIQPAYWLRGGLRPGQSGGLSKKQAASGDQVAWFLGILYNGKQANLLLDYAPWVPGKLRSCIPAAFELVGPFCVSCFEEIAPSVQNPVNQLTINGQKLWSVSLPGLFDHLLNFKPMPVSHAQAH